MSDPLLRYEARADFSRERRARALARIASRLRMEPDDVSVMLPFDEVVSALGRRGQVDLGVRTIPLDSIVGTVDRRRGQFDRHFRPASTTTRGRWEQIAAARRRGETLPPIDVYRIGDLHFVRDGHHRVSIALATGLATIDAYVTEVRTTLPAHNIARRGDLVMKSYERVFFARVPLPPHARAQITVTDSWNYAELSSAVEAWGFRWMQHEGRFGDRTEVAARWYADEYLPVVRMLREAQLLGTGTEAEAYLRVSRERYRLIRTHEWNDEVIRRLQQELT